MLITATQKYTRQTPRKVRLVANSVRDKDLPQALEHLSVMQRRASLEVLKVVRQAVANAMNNHGYQLSDLKIKTIMVHKGPTYKRFRAVSRGRAHSIEKQTCHIQVELLANEPEQKAEKIEKTKLPKEVAAQKSTPAKATKVAKTTKVAKPTSKAKGKK